MGRLKSSKQKVGCESSGNRRCTPTMFERHNKNGEIVNRSWLCFSPTTARVYCYVCKLQFTHGGFCDWKHASNRLSDHERSKSHRRSAKNNLAAWIPRVGHSLNLVVKAAAECCTAAVSFFDILECVQHLHIVTKS